MRIAKYYGTCTMQQASSTEFIAEYFIFVIVKADKSDKVETHKFALRYNFFYNVKYYLHLKIKEKHIVF